MSVQLRRIIVARQQPRERRVLRGIQSTMDGRVQMSSATLMAIKALPPESLRRMCPSFIVVRMFMKIIPMRVIMNLGRGMVVKV
jgi:hypothetical protein